MRAVRDHPRHLVLGALVLGLLLATAGELAMPAAAVVVALVAGRPGSATLAVAALSWFGVEKPALRLKARALGRRTLKTIEPAAP